MKCEICKQRISTTFLDKIIGTYIKDSNGKKHAICSICQKKLNPDNAKGDALKLLGLESQSKKS